MHKMIVWWLKNSFIIMVITGGLYGLGQSGFIFDARRFPFKILLMLLVIEATPLGAAAGWGLVKAAHFLLFFIPQILAVAPSRNLIKTGALCQR